MRLPNAGRIYPSYVYAGLPKKSPLRQKRRICLRQIHANRPIQAGFRPNAAPAQRGSRLFRQPQGKSALPCVFNGGFSERNFSRQRKVFWGQIAQSVEQRTENPRVGSSNLSLAKTKALQPFGGKAAEWLQSVSLPHIIRTEINPHFFCRNARGLAYIGVGKARDTARVNRRPRNFPRESYCQ